MSTTRPKRLQLSRRTVMSGFGALACAGLAPSSPGAAQTSPVLVGDIAVMPLSDGHLDLPLAAFAKLPEATSPPKQMQRLGAHAWLIQAGHRVMLVDTGAGVALRESFPMTGQMPDALTAAGIQAKDVTVIIITHMHPDHIGGLMDGEKARYPNAMLHVCEVEWRFWMAPDRPQTMTTSMQSMARQIAALAEQIAYHVAIHPVGGHVGEGVWLEPAPGHTPGHQIVHVASGDKELLLLGDALISGNLQFAHPDVEYAFDIDPAQAAATRRALFDRIAADRATFAATHLSHGGAYQLDREGRSGYRAFLAET